MIRKKLEENNAIISVNVLHTKKKKIYPPYLSKDNSNPQRQVIVSVIPIGEGSKEPEAKEDNDIIWQKKELSALLRGITSKRYWKFYCFNWLHSLRAKKT